MQSQSLLKGSRLLHAVKLLSEVNELLRQLSEDSSAVRAGQPESPDQTADQEANLGDEEEEEEQEAEEEEEDEEEEGEEEEGEEEAECSNLEGLEEEDVADSTESWRTGRRRRAEAVPRQSANCSESFEATAEVCPMACDRSCLLHSQARGRLVLVDVNILGSPICQFVGTWAASSERRRHQRACRGHQIKCCPPDSGFHATTLRQLRVWQASLQFVTVSNARNCLCSALVRSAQSRGCHHSSLCFVS